MMKPVLLISLFMISAALGAPTPCPTCPKNPLKASLEEAVKIKSQTSKQLNTDVKKRHTFSNVNVPPSTPVETVTNIMKIPRQETKTKKEHPFPTSRRDPLASRESISYQKNVRYDPNSYNNLPSQRGRKR